MPILLPIVCGDCDEIILDDTDLIDEEDGTPITPGTPAFDDLVNTRQLEHYYEECLESEEYLVQ